MWTPTHVQVTVQKAKGLLTKGKNGTNDAFVTIALGKEKYQTSVKERATDPAEWHEECELPIPKQGNKAEIVLTVLHRNFIGDEFLGLTTVPLQEFDVYEKPKNKWYTLKSKPGKEKTKYRGEIEVRIGFTVQSGVNAAGSLSDFSKKDGLRSSFGQLSHMASSVGGSLLSLRSKEKKTFKNLAKAVGNKVATLPGRGKKKNKDEQFGTIPEQQIYSGQLVSNQRKGEADPGVVSDDEDEFRFDELSHKSSHSSLSASQVGLNAKEESLENMGGGEFLRKNYATPPPGKARGSPFTTNENESSLSSTRGGSGNTTAAGEPVDEWEAKLFGKQNLSTKPPHSGHSSLNSSPIPNQKMPVVEMEPEMRKEIEVPKFENNSGVKRPSANNGVPTATMEKEPVPKPRQVHDLNKNDMKTSQAVDESNSGVKEFHVKSKVMEKEKSSSRIFGKHFHQSKSSNDMSANQTTDDTLQEAPTKTEEKYKTIEKDKHKSARESFASIFNSKSKEQEDSSTRNGTPVGITNPIRMKDNKNQDSRLRKEVIRKYESKSRDDLIEMIVNLQSTVDNQKQKMNDMEDYIDNLLVRVMENKPTLLQSQNGASEDEESQNGNEISNKTSSQMSTKYIVKQY